MFSGRSERGRAAWASASSASNIVGRRGATSCSDALVVVDQARMRVLEVDKSADWEGEGADREEDGKDRKGER